MSTKPGMLQLSWARPRLIQLELHLSGHGLIMHELRAAGVPERRIRGLYPSKLEDYTDRLSRAVLHEPFYTACMRKLGYAGEQASASPFYPPASKGFSTNVPTLADGSFGVDSRLGELHTALMRLMFRAHGVPHEAGASTATLALTLYAIPGLLSFYHACAMYGLTPQHPADALHVFKPWVFEGQVDFLIEQLEGLPA